MRDPGLTIWSYGPKKYKFRLLQDLPSNFLKWIAENCNKKNVAEDADAEWRFREKHNCHIEEE